MTVKDLPRRPFDGQAKMRALLTEEEGKHYKPIVYRFYDVNMVVLYVGHTTTSISRIAAHRGTSWWARAAYVKITICGTRAEAISLERQEILRDAPEFNKQTWDPLPVACCLLHTS